MFLVPVNYFAVVVSGIAHMIIGFLWYGPIFGKEWMSLVGMTKEKMEKAKKEGMEKKYLVSFFLSLLMAYALEHFIWFTAPGATTLTIGIKSALWVWVGFIATNSASSYLFSAENKPLKLYLLDNGYMLTSLIAMGAILSLWP